MQCYVYKLLYKDKLMFSRVHNLNVTWDFAVLTIKVIYYEDLCIGRCLDMENAASNSSLVVLSSGFFT